MKRLVVPQIKFDKMFEEKYKPNINSLGFSPRHPYESDEEYKMRAAEYWNPPIPNQVCYWTGRGPVLLIRGTNKRS